MSEDGKPPSLADFDARLRKARAARKSGKEDGAPVPSGLGLGMRVAVEMAAAVGLSVGVGWLLDEWLGTRPWLMVVFLPLGFAAGILNTYRAAARSATAGKASQAEGDGDSPDH
jgi:ATP synthase protein I